MKLVPILVCSLLVNLIACWGPVSRILDRLELRWRIFLCKLYCLPEDDSILKLRIKTGMVTRM